MVSFRGVKLIHALNFISNFVYTIAKASLSIYFIRVDCADLFNTRTATQLLTCVDLARLADWSSTPVQHPAWFALQENSTVTFTCGCSNSPGVESKIYWQRSTRLADEYELLSAELSSSIGNEQQANSTLVVPARADNFGLQYSCICSTNISNHMSKPVQLRFLRMHRHEYGTILWLVIYAASFLICLLNWPNILSSDVIAFREILA